jgi:hypothetical protein
MFGASTGIGRVTLAGSVMAALVATMGPGWADGGAGDPRGRKAAEERDMLDRARQEAPANMRRLDGTVSMPVHGTSRVITNIGEPRPVDEATLEANRRAELDRLSEKIRRASAARGKIVAPVIDTPWTTEVVMAPSEPLAPENRYALGKPIGHPAPASRSHLVTVLMIMKPGNRGIRRLEKTADPLLCTAEGCYISAGGDLPARFLSTARSLSIANTFGDRAGACRNQTACVFRAVDLGAAPTFVRPIDMRVVHHDRREIKRVAADESCQVQAGRLSCQEAVRADDYTLWVVPERVAAEAGAAALQQALETGLERQ